MSASLDDVLHRLDGVRRSGEGWMARCPAHDDRSPSLRVGEGEDGRVLIHCYAACAPIDVVAALGLSLADLFERRSEHHSPRRRPSLTAREVLSVLAYESHVVALAAGDIVQGRVLSEEDLLRVAVAANRLQEVRRYAGL